VFKSDFYDTAPFHKVLGKCCVIFVKEYFKYRPEVSLHMYHICLWNSLLLVFIVIMSVVVL